MMIHPYEVASAAADELLDRLGPHRVAVVLGSGWAPVAERLGTVTASLPATSLTGVPAPTVPGHDGLIHSVDAEGAPGVLGVRKSLTAAAKDDFWKIRKAGLSLLMGLVGDAKPVAFVEDTAVSVEKLPEFYRRFERIVTDHGTPAVIVSRNSPSSS